MLADTSFRAAAVQMNTQDDKAHNLDRAVSLIGSAVSQGAQMVALPENFNYLGTPEAQVDNAETITGPSLTCMADQGRAHGIYLCAGSILEKVEGEEKLFNTSVLFGPDGDQVARYRKVHLFDIDVTGQVAANESAIMAPGNEIVVAETDLATLGMSICYDLRFPELYRSLALQGAQLIAAPAAFTLYTGKDHWELLVRARAVENTVYLVAPAQFGRYPDAEHSFGNTMIVDPWGTVVARAADREVAVVADVDLGWQATVRTAVPSLRSRRPDVYRLDPPGDTAFGTQRSGKQLPETERETP